MLMKKLLTLLFVFTTTVTLYVGCRKKDAPIDIPVCVDNVGPTNGARVETRTVRLSWTSARSAKTYDVYLDTVPRPETRIASGVADTALTYTLPLAENTTYYWFVVPKNGGEKPGCASSPTSFTYSSLPGCAINLFPSDTGYIRDSVVTLIWTKVLNTENYDVYVDTTPTITTPIATGVSDTSYRFTVPSTASNIYYWYVVPKNSLGHDTACASSVTSFKYGSLPDTTSNILPANGSNITTNTVQFSWGSVDDVTTYDLYLGTSTEGATLVVSGLSDTTYLYNLVEPQISTTYYWYVVPKNKLGSAAEAQGSATSFKRLIIKSPPELGFSMITYFPSYRYVAEYPDNMFAMCDVINYAFAAVNTSGTITISSLTRFDSLYKKAKANSSKVFISISGATNFASAARTAQGRNNLITDIMKKVRQYSLDGIDIDWEYPRTTDGTDVTYAALMKELSDSLHTDGKYYLSSAITPGIYAGSVRDGIKTEVFNYADFFNIMAYDDFTTDPRYPFKQHSSMSTATVSLNYWLNTRGMPRQKFILGIPGYGRNSGAAQVSSSYKNILLTGQPLGPAPLHQSDSATMTKTDGTTFTTYYNGVLTVANKTNLAKTRGNGIFFWELGHDANNEFSLHKAAADAAGITY